MRTYVRTSEYLVRLGSRSRRRVQTRISGEPLGMSALQAARITACSLRRPRIEASVRLRAAMPSLACQCAADHSISRWIRRAPRPQVPRGFETGARGLHCPSLTFIGVVSLGSLANIRLYMREVMLVSELLLRWRHFLWEGMFSFFFGSTYDLKVRDQGGM